MRPQRLINSPLILPPKHNSRQTPRHKPKQVQHPIFPMPTRIEYFLSTHQAQHKHKQIQIAIEHAEFGFYYVAGWWGCVFDSWHELGLGF